MPKKRVAKPTKREMQTMLQHIDEAHKAGGRAFTVYENRLEAYIRDLIREVNRLRRRKRDSQR